MHSLAWQINRSFNMNLCMSLDWVRKKDSSDASRHLHYFCRFEDVELNWHLIKNKGDRSYFFNSKPLFDYLLLCNGEDIYGYFERAVEAYKNSDQAGQIFSFGFELLKQKDDYFENILQTRYFIEDLNV
jgi:hypothetical protein